MTKTVNVYIVCDLAAWSRNPTNNFKFKNCLFGATTVLKNSDNEKYVYSGYGITFDSEGSWSSDNGTARDVISFGDFIKPNTKFCLSLHYNADNSSLLIEKKSLNLKSILFRKYIWCI